MCHSQKNSFNKSKEGDRIINVCLNELPGQVSKFIVDHRLNKHQATKRQIAHRRRDSSYSYPDVLQVKFGAQAVLWYKKKIDATIKIDTS